MLGLGFLAATTNSSSGGGGGATVIVIVVLIGGGIFLRHRMMKRNREKGTARTQLRLQQIGASTHFPVGTLVAGLSGATSTQVVCAPAPSELVFLPNLMTGHNPGDLDQPAPELGRIPRDAVDSLNVTDATQTQQHVQVVQRLSVTRMALLGPLSLAAPKRKKVQNTTTTPKFLLNLRWTDRNGIGQETVFQFANGAAANQAEHSIRQSLKPKTHAAPAPAQAPMPQARSTSTLAADEKRCPMCAEVIKAAAVKCRYCGSDLAGALA